MSEILKISVQISCLLIILFSFSMADAEERQIFEFNPEVGQTKKFSATVTNNKLPTPLILNGTMKVLGVHPNRMVMEYEANSITILGVTLAAGDPRAAESFVGIVVKYEADTDGSPLRLTNRDQVLRSFRAIEDIPEDAHVFFSELPDEMLASIVLRVPTYASICQNVDFSNGAVIQHEINQSGDNGLTQKGTVTYSLSKTDADTNIAKINYSEELTISASGQVGAKTATADCNVLMNDGWTRSVVYSLDRSSGMQKKFESWDIQFD